MTMRLKLFFLWFGGYSICVVLLFLFVIMGDALIDQVTDYLTQITGIFAPYLTPIIAFWFSEDIIGNKRAQTQQSTIVAFTTSGFFNLVMLIILFSVFFQDSGEGVIENTISVMAGVSTLLAFIAGPDIGYFFSQTKDKAV